jgi:hypothetical protein
MDFRGKSLEIKDASGSVRSSLHELGISHSMTGMNGGVSPPEEAAEAA